MHRTVSNLTALLLALCFQASNASIVVTEQGLIEGISENGVRSFKGIPYALPPTGQQRWQPPVAVPVNTKAYQASGFGPMCMQPDRPVSGMSEDCLTLNIWTPIDGAEKHPVLVWIHGGGFVAGSGNIPGEVFAELGAVVVSINYRLGPLGFFAHDALPDRPANFGVLDMILALEWLQSNIEAFGGDPGNVTIFGVSAGGMAVGLLASNDLAKGLFHRAIAQSGYGTWALPRSTSAPTPAPKDMYMQSAEKAETLASEFVRRVTDRPQTQAMLYQLPASELLKGIKGFQLPIVDGISVQEEPGIRFIRGKQHDIPLMTGGNSYEGSVMPRSGISAQDYTRILGEAIDQARQLYRDDDESVWLQRMWGDNRYLLAARVLGDNMKNVSSSAWLYYIDFQTAAESEKAPGTTHGRDRYFLFSGHLSADAEVRELSTRLRQYWFNFARLGNPNGDGLASWPDYQRQTDTWLVISHQDRASTGVVQAKVDFLESMYQKRIGMP